MNYYNENDPNAAAWLRELIAQGLIPAGTVDERSITEVKPNDLTGYNQCHFFAGIGGWPLALALAGVSESRPVWTGSCPCQPFSGAGEGKGASDDRHLWPVFRRLIAELHPERVFGEQVAQAIGFNWLDGVSADLEADGYAVGAVVLGAHSVGAPHIRQRLFWVADSKCGGCASGAVIGDGAATIITPENRATSGMEISRDHGTWSHAGKISDIGGESLDAGAESLRQAHGEVGTSGTDSRSAGGHWDDALIIQGLDGKARRIEPGTFPLADGIPGRVGLLRGYGNAIVPQVAATFVRAFFEISSR